MNRLKRILFFLGIISHAIYAVDYVLRSEGGRARIKKDGNVIASVDQWRNYDLIINSNSTVNLVDVGPAGGNYGWIRDIKNDSGLALTINWKDNNNTFSLNNSSVRKLEFHRTIPWDSAGQINLKIEPQNSQSVMNAKQIPDKGFAFLSINGNAIMFKDGKEFGSKYPQWRNYKIIIDKNGNPSFQDVGPAGGNYAYITEISNPYGFKITVNYHDSGKSLKAPISDRTECSISFNSPVPWNNNSNQKFQMQVTASTQETLKSASRKYKITSEGGYVFIEDQVSGERLDESLGQFAQYNLIIGPRGTLCLRYIGHHAQNVGLIKEVQNPCGYLYHIEYSDSSAGACNPTSSQKTLSWDKPVPWKEGDNHMSVHIQVPDFGNEAVNGYRELSNKRFNESMLISTHNGQSHKKSLTSQCEPANVANQNRSFKQQLYDGVRASKTPLFRKGDEIITCHGFRAAAVGAECNVDKAARPFHDILNTLKQFLDAHPREVFLLEIEDVTDNNRRPTDKVKIDGKEETIISAGDNGRLSKMPQEMQEKYNKMSADYKWSDNKLRELFMNSGLEKYIYFKEDDGKPWPTLREMVSMNKRLVVTVDSFYTRNKPFLSMSDWGIMTKYDYTTWQDLLNSAPNDTNLSKSNENSLKKLKSGIGVSSLSLGVARPGYWAACINDLREVNKQENVTKKINQFKSWCGHYPTQVSCDYYQVPDFGVFLAVNAINGVTYK